MNYQQVLPSAATSHFVKCYWFLEDDSSGHDIQRIVPDGRPELIFNLGQPFENFVNDKWVRQPEAFFAGQITGPFLIRPCGPARVFGIRFHPHGASRLLGLPIHELTDSVVALDDLSRRLFSEWEQLSELNSLSQQFLALDCIMQEIAEQSGAFDPLVAHTVAQFERNGGMMNIADAAEEVGLSSRQLERRFRDTVGISPKLFCRMQRFQRIFHVMESPGADWVSDAVHCGYYDQAHLIRDFREFSGKTPTALLGPEVDLARHFLQSHVMSHFSKTVANASL